MPDQLSTSNLISIFMSGGTITQPSNKRMCPAMRRYPHSADGVRRSGDNIFVRLRGDNLLTDVSGSQAITKFVRSPGDNLIVRLSGDTFSTYRSRNEAIHILSRTEAINYLVTQQQNVKILNNTSYSYSIIGTYCLSKYTTKSCLLLNFHDSSRAAMSRKVRFFDSLI